DGSGNAIALTDINQQIVNSYSYTPFGEIINKTENIPNPFLFGGQYGIMQEDGNLYYARARYFDASVGRFISEDPSGFADGPNIYSYAQNNPVVFVDPLGLSTEKAWWQQLEEGYYYGTGFGIDAVAMYAMKYNETGNPLWIVPGGFAALWTPETYQVTGWTLIAAYGIRSAGRTWKLADGSVAYTPIDYGNILRIEKHFIGKGSLRAIKWHIDALGNLIKHWPWNI
ncbi:MAG: RHS repeat-associated core domain-containing protein, partial [Candidatus Omnitrophica bacterium]|nr:RHS repeat-associated core domain-containing protein [Candidatus Omnitrophota bacterium]